VLFFSNCCKWLSLCESYLLNCHVDYNWVLWCLLNKQTNWWNSQHLFTAHGSFKDEYIMN
jgi:hypothetical protein